MGNGETSTQYRESHLMTSEDIKEIIRYCGIAAERARRAGFDGVSVHNAHSDIMFGACSLDPMFNNRDDEWGGPIENRLRFTVEMVKEMKRGGGEDFPVSLRINGDDLKGELGNTSEDICKYIVPALEEAGLDYIDVSQGGSLYAGQGCLPVLYYPRACWVHLAAALKKAAHIPVIGVGRVTSLEMALAGRPMWTKSGSTSLKREKTCPVMCASVSAATPGVSPALSITRATAWWDFWARPFP